MEEMARSVGMGATDQGAQAAFWSRVFGRAMQEIVEALEATAMVEVAAVVVVDKEEL
jgi:hypothetical protein